MADEVKIPDLTADTTPALTDVTVTVDLGANETKKITWQAIRDLFAGFFHSGDGTSGKIPKYTGARTQADSIITESGTNIDVGGSLSANGPVRFLASMLGSSSESYMSMYLDNTVYGAKAGQGHYWGVGGSDRMGLSPGGKLDTLDGFSVGGVAGATGSFTTVDGKTVTVTKGVITSIV